MLDVRRSDRWIFLTIDTEGAVEHFLKGRAEMVNFNGDCVGCRSTYKLDKQHSASIAS